jgi:hypothetical protein
MEQTKSNLLRVGTGSSFGTDKVNPICSWLEWVFRTKKCERKPKDPIQCKKGSNQNKEQGY